MKRSDGEIKPMNSRHLYLVTTTLILAFTLAACNLPSKAGPTSTPIIMDWPEIYLTTTPTNSPTQTVKPSSTSSGSCTNAYFPISSGATWSYASTGSLAGDYTYIRTLSGLNDTGFTTIDVLGTVTRTVTWSCDRGNLTSLATASSNALVSSSSMKMTVDSVNATGYVIPNAFTDGKTWSEGLMVNATAVQEGKDPSTVVSQVTTTCTTAGAESVKVPAGTFDTVKITCHSNQVATVTTKGISGGPITTIQDSTQWYAQGVGMVQTVNTGDAGSETIQLTSYSIP
jgi:hypothetical protein